MRTTLHQLSLLRDTVERSAATQRERIDQALVERRRKDALAAIGELVVELSAAGELPFLAKYPEIAAAIDELDRLDGELDDYGQTGPARWDKSRARHQDGSGAARWDKSRARHSSGGRPPGSDLIDAGLGADEPADWDSPADDESEDRAEASRPSRRKFGGGSGRGIQFEVDDTAPRAAGDDDDLSDYMTDGDVPE